MVLVGEGETEPKVLGAILASAPEMRGLVKA